MTSGSVAMQDVRIYYISGCLVTYKHVLVECLTESGSNLLILSCPHLHCERDIKKAVTPHTTLCASNVVV
jgi:hypothetical protein